jgi:DNA-binding response OmpR family regulator
MARWAGSFGPIRLRVLVVEHDPTTARLLAAAVAARLLNTEVEITTTLDAAARRLRQTPFDAVLACDGLRANPAAAVIELKPLLDGPVLLRASGDMAFAVDAMRRGADDVMPGDIAPHLAAERLAARVNEAASTPATGFMPTPRLVGGFLAQAAE